MLSEVHRHNLSVVMADPYLGTSFHDATTARSGGSCAVCDLGLAAWYTIGAPQIFRWPRLLTNPR
jgi:hypothetical protein